MATETREIDWSTIERDYRAGVKTLRAIAAEHHITHGAVRKRAMRDGWVQDLRDRILAKARDTVSKAAVSKTGSAKGQVSDKQIVDANADVIARAELAQRDDVRRAREVVRQMIDELGAKQLTDKQVRQLAVAASALNPDTAADERKKIVMAILDSMDLGSRAQIAQKLASALAILIDKERLVLNMDDKAAPESALIASLKRIRGVE